MSRSLPIHAFLGFVLLLSCQPASRAAEPPTKETTAKKYRALVAQLASPNKRPVTDEDSVRFPTGYDVKAQIRVEEARRILHDDIEDSLPYLVEAFDDDRYCLTINWADGDAYYNRSIGEVCENIVASQLEVYRDSIRFSGSQEWNRYNYPISKRWWEKRKGNSLVELQIEAIDWAIGERQADSEAGGDTAKEIAELKKLRNSISKSRKPATANGMWRTAKSKK